MTETRLLSIAQRFWPELESMPKERRLIGIGDVITFLSSIPLAVGGLVALILVTDTAVLGQNLVFVLFSFLLMLILDRLGFFLIIEIRENRYGSTHDSLAGIPLWAALFLLGPSVLWMFVGLILIEFIARWQRAVSTSARWIQLRILTMGVAGTTVAPLIAFWAYRALGGELPLSELRVDTITIALVAQFVHFIMHFLLWAFYLAYAAWSQRVLVGRPQAQPILMFFVLAIGLPHLGLPFGILGAGLYVQNGMLVYAFFMVGMVIVAFLTRRLSWAAESSRQQSRLLEKMELLGRAFIKVPPPNPTTLPELLLEHMPNMFPAGRLVIWTFPDRVLYVNPLDWKPDLESRVNWLQDQETAHAFQSGQHLPWEAALRKHNPVVITPIQDVISQKPFGGIYLELHTLAQPWDQRSLQNLLPPIQTLADQIATVWHQAKVYTQTLEYQRVAQELRLAGSIQSSLLPFAYPTIPGWQLAVTLYPVEETSGDFFDIIPLPDGKLGIVIADVLDKGVGPALFMSLSRTLIRTYAIEFDSPPDLVFFAANERILKDTSTNMFVTAFLGIIDPQKGTMIYSNAGHNPPYLVSPSDEDDLQVLSQTGIPIGIEEGATWGPVTVEIHPGDMLVLYTDGIPDAKNETGQLFHEQSLVKVIQANLGRTAEEIQTAILDAVYQFVGEAPQVDDITLMVLVRDR